MQSMSVFLDIAKPDFRGKMLMSADLTVWHVTHFFGPSLGKINCATFHHCRMCDSCREWVRAF